MNAKHFEKINRLALILVLAALSACGTVAPKTNVATRASFDKQDTVKATSGILDFWKNKKGEVIGRIVTPHYKERYAALVDLYGDQFQPALKKDEGFTLMDYKGAPAFGVNKATHSNFGVLLQWKRNGRVPTGTFKKMLNKFT